MKELYWYNKRLTLYHSGDVVQALGLAPLYDVITVPVFNRFKFPLIDGVGAGLISTSNRAHDVIIDSYSLVIVIIRGLGWVGQIAQGVFALPQDVTGVTTGASMRARQVVMKGGATSG